MALGGDTYAGGGLVLALIMCSVAFSCVQGVFGNALVTQGRQKALLRVSISILVCNGVINLAAIPLFGDVGAASALLATEILSLAMTMGVYRRYAPLPRPQKPLRTLVALGVLVVIATACVTVSSSTLAMVIAVALGLAAYIATLIVLRVLPPYIEAAMLTMLRSIRPRSATPAP